MERIYRVEVMGFNTTERIMLGSVFNLSLRRSPSYRRAEPGEQGHLLLVDGAHAECIAEANARLAATPINVLLVADTEHPEGWPTIARPLHWARLFKAMDSGLGFLTHGVATQQAGARRAPLLGTEETQTLPTMRTPAQPAAGGQSPATAATRSAQTIASRARPLLIVSAITHSEGQPDPAAPEIVLRPSGHALDCVDTPERAMARLIERDYACILIDLSLPDGAAFTLSRTVGTRLGPGAPARILYAPQPSAVQRWRAHRAGCEAVVATATDGAALAAVVTRLAGAPGESRRRGERVG